MTRLIKAIQHVTAVFAAFLDGSTKRRRHLKQRAALAMCQTTGHRLVRARHINHIKGATW